MQTLKVPLIGTTVAPDAGDAANGVTPPPAPTPQQPAQRASLHQVRMPRPDTPAPEFQPSWDDRGRVKWVQVEQASVSETEAPDADGAADVESPDAHQGMGETGGFDVPPHPDAQAPTSQTFDALQQQIQNLTQTVSLLAQAQLQGMQPPKPQAPQPPDPSQFDMYDPQQFAEFTKLNTAYLKAEVAHQVNAAIAPHDGALQDAQIISQHNRLVGQHGDNPNFKAYMDAAVNLVAQSNHRFSLAEAFNFVASAQVSSPRQTAAVPASPQPAKPAQRTITAQEAAQKREQANSLPPRNGVSGAAEPGLPANLNNVGALGRIMLHNQQTGRARPI